MTIFSASKLGAQRQKPAAQYLLRMCTLLKMMYWNHRLARRKQAGQMWYDRELISRFNGDTLRPHGTSERRNRRAYLREETYFPLVANYNGCSTCHPVTNTRRRRSCREGMRNKQMLCKCFVSHSLLTGLCQ